MRKVITAGVILFWGVFCLKAETDSVRMWEETVVLPAYRTAKPCVLPIFYNGRAYQGAKGPVYPYPLQDNLTRKIEEKSYTAVYLENEYLKISILPEIGGRIFSALDKTNNYNFFYRQNVIKPALVGMLGAWISGGVEWNFPHHHRAASFMPVDYILKENPDGSRTVWVGELEYRHRMRWMAGLTLYPGKSFLEVTLKLINRTPYAHSFLCWANNAVHTNKNYEVIFPPDTQFATYHGKNQFARWPIVREIYHRTDYSEGVHAGWWKNHPSPTSFFAWKSKGNFLAGYDHGREAGVVHVANPHWVPGKKFWTWGTGAKGEMWEQILTDEDGPYLELMIGAFSDNQPDYSWLHPYEVKEIRQHWYPLREIKGVKKAAKEAAVNLEIIAPGKGLAAFNTTSVHPEARWVLKAGEDILIEQTLSIAPDKPFCRKVDIPEDIRAEELKIQLWGEDGKILIEYSPQPLEEKPLPEPVKPPPPPEKILSQEELYLTGLRLEQFHNPAVEPYLYYREALKRDPGDSRVNTRLGILYAKRFMYREARKKLNAAAARQSRNETHPKNTESLYYLGEVNRTLGEFDCAINAFYHAAWSYAWAAPSCHNLSRIASIQGGYSQALELIHKSLQLNTLNTRGMNLKAALLRRLGRAGKALNTAQEILKHDPLNFRAKNEIYLARKDLGEYGNADAALQILTRMMRDSAQSYLELALDYSGCGMYDEALDVLFRLIQSGSESSSYPMLFYHAAYLLEKTGRKFKAREYYEKAARMPPEYCFPFRSESISVLKRAQEVNPQDSRAPYYLGNLLFDRQPREAVREWEKSIRLDPEFFIAHRNLALAYARIENDLSSSLTHMEKAAAGRPRNPRLYYELDLLYEAAGVSPQKRLAVLEKNHSVVKKRDDALAREISLLVHLGRYDQALRLLESNHFHIWEGGGSIHRIFADAHILRGLRFLHQKEHLNAVQDFEKALEYPVNLQAGRPRHGGRTPEAHYFIARAWKAAGKKEKAELFYEKCVQNLRPRTRQAFFQGLALIKLGSTEQAEKLFNGLIQAGEARLQQASELNFFAKFGEKQTHGRKKAEAHFISGLGFLGKDQKEKARGHFQKALDLNPSHTWAQYYLEFLDNP